VKQEVSNILFKAKTAAAIFSQYDQDHVDRIVKAVYRVAFDNRIKLAKMAVEETGLGRFEDKVMKNVIASQMVYYDIRNQKTAGIISEDEEKGILEIAQPLGPIFAIIPITNPTSTTIYKILISLKTRNPIIVHPHRRAAQCTIEAAKLCYEAAIKEDAPEDCIQWVTGFSREDTQQVMGHHHVALILATGGSGLVKAAYSSGTPALGVGAGNVPVFIDKTADVDFAIEQILSSKMFDNGTICASEQAVVVQKDMKDKVMAAFFKHGAYLMNDDEIEKVSKFAYDTERKSMTGDVVGKSAEFIAESVGISIPEGTSVLLANLNEVGDDVPLSSEILAPILAIYVEDDFDKAVNRCIDLNFHGGVGHTASIFSNDEEMIRKFSLLMNAGRIVVNMPSSQGAVGITSKLEPSLTLGCGTGGKNITTDNISARHLLNIQRIARRRDDFLFVRFDKNKYLDENFKAEMLDKEFYKNI
jgi:acetaldehyde dehydrogenase/alcohol dehydrogenase